MNKLIFGDNLNGLKTLTKRYSGRIKLIYIDPPFSTNNTFRISNGRTATISMGASSEIAYSDTLTGTEYLSSLRERLKIAHELLASDGSLYLHIDCKIAYEVKNILDEIFTHGNFRNSISRIKSNPKNFSQKGYGSVKDTILFYTKSGNYTWNEPRVQPKHLDKFIKEDSKGRYNTTPIHAPNETKNGDTGKKWRGKLPPVGRHWRYSRKKLDELDEKGLIEWSKTGNPRLKVYAEDVKAKGILLQDIWEFKDPQYPQYPTEKNLDMLETIIKASSDPKDIVLDFYCGSGTTLLASVLNDRKFIGIDKSDKAIECCKDKLSNYKYTFIEL